ncbi:hypothetical protein LZD49_33965 [Dyadobacter sp. CY261]|uniref:hypothetical protein n=1 Tax=Dyadobacter sp. CY261 TaxID=2907203 RepID=UPI001F34E6E7|nr:hypothetical protein [Dyadobacter sp. CY261]MCF0075531.1 hypothetical protein [Dyadobacter sp. CY261]
MAGELTDERHKSSTSSISVVGNDVYISGSEFTGTNSGARMWKNGVRLPLNIDSDECYGVELAVSGGDVYLAGFENVAGTFAARY